MTLSRRRTAAIARKELHEYRRNGSIVATMAVLPTIFLIEPVIQVFALPAATSSALARNQVLLYLLAVPVLVPTAPAAYAVVGERLQGTLEPLLATPVRRDELLLGKALAAFVPSLVIAYAAYAAFLVVVYLFADPAVESALIQRPQLLAQLVFTPPLAAWSTWVSIGISTRCRDPRTASQLALLLSLPTLAVTTLVAFNVIPANLGVALGLGAALLALTYLGWRITTSLFDRERLITGST